MKPKFQENSIIFRWDIRKGINGFWESDINQLNLGVKRRIKIKAISPTLFSCRRGEGRETTARRHLLLTETDVVWRGWEESERGNDRRIKKSEKRRGTVDSCCFRLLILRKADFTRNDSPSYTCALSSQRAEVYVMMRLISCIWQLFLLYLIYVDGGG